VGEATGRYLGQSTLRAWRRGEQSRPVMAWAETGRTDGLEGSLMDMAGAPVLDGSGAVAGVVLVEAPRRGRLYTASRNDIDKALAAADVQPPAFTGAEPVNGENYGRVADNLRRDLRVIRVACLSR
jgi:serine protease Do